MILKKIKNIVKWVVVLFFSTTILAVVAYRFIPVYVTPLMFIRCFQQVADGESITLHHHWVSMDKISPHMPVAVMASEDARFLKHHGFDFNAIESAAKNNARGGKVHGAKLRAVALVEYHDHLLAVDVVVGVLLDEVG